MRLRTIFVLLLGTAGVTSCGLYSATGHFALNNTSGDNVRLVVAGKLVGPVVGPNSPARFDTPIPMPSQQGTDPTYKVTNVDVAVKDLTTSELSRPTSCVAGENTLTSVTYSVYSDGFVQISCTNSY